MKLRILHLTQFLGIGGLEKVLHILIREQMSAGHHVELIVYDWEQAWVEAFRQDGIYVNTSYSKQPGYDRGLLKFINQAAKNYDVIHTHDLNPFMYAAPLKLWNRLTLGTFPKLIHTAHGMDHIQKRPITKIYERLSALAADHVVGVSPSVCSQYQAIGVNPAKIHNINNSTRIPFLTSSKTEDRRFLIEEFGLNDSNPIVSTVARIVPLKDQKLICQVALKMPAVNFLLIGPSGDEKYWNELQAMKPSNVIMTDGRKDIDRILNGSDLFLSASHHEGIPISVLEAGALALPCLLSDIPGHRIISAEAKDVARFFSKGNVDECLSELHQLLNSPEEGQKLGKNLKDLVYHRFSSQRMHREYEQLYLC